MKNKTIKGAFSSQSPCGQLQCNMLRALGDSAVHTVCNDQGRGAGHLHSNAC